MKRIITLPALLRTGILTIAIVCLIIPLQAATIYYVKTGAAGDGSSWQNASGDLQAMINQSVAGDQIWVANGTYVPTRPINNLTTIDPGNRYNAFLLKKDVGIYGGFTGTETLVTERQPAQNETILSGDFNGNDGTNFSNYTENAYRAVAAVGDASSGLLDGFMVTGGNADGSGNGTTVVVNNLVVEDYTSTGIMIKSSSPTIRNCIFKNNTTQSTGGGVSCTSNSSPVIQNCSFTDNHAANSGGGAYVSQSTPVFMNCNFLRNQAAYGAGINNSLANAAYINCLVSRNVCDFQGGGFANFMNSPVIINCTISYNISPYGPGMHNNQMGNMTVKNCIIWGNFSGYGNVGVNNVDGTPSFTYCNIQDGVVPGTENISQDPLFVDAGNNNYRLTAESPSVNSGSNSLYDATLYGNKDLANNNRIINSTIDMGAYEFGGTVVGINSVSGENMQLYPNPVKDRLYITTTPETNARGLNIKITDLTGRTLQQAIVTDGSITLGQLPNGIYMAHITSSNGINKIEKILKQ